MHVDPKQRKVLVDDLEAHANAQNAVRFPLLFIRAREADVLMLMSFSLAPRVSLDRLR